MANIIFYAACVFLLDLWGWEHSVKENIFSNAVNPLKYNKINFGLNIILADHKKTLFPRRVEFHWLVSPLYFDEEGAPMKSYCTITWV